MRSEARRNNGARMVGGQYRMQRPVPTPLMETAPAPTAAAHPLVRWSRLWASRCTVCGTWPATPVGDALCGTCETVFAPAQARCPRCALPRPAGSASQATPTGCPDCHTPSMALDHCAAAVDYVHPWPGLIHRFKAGGEPAWAQVFARLLCTRPEAVGILLQAQWWLPVPLTTRHLGERGYNQAWVLTQALRTHLKPQHPVEGRCHADLLVKLADTPAQHTLDRSQRLTNLRHAFGVTPRGLAVLPGQSVVLVDDVMTTGATLDAVARCLKAAGAATVSAVVLARTPRPETQI